MRKGKRMRLARNVWEAYKMYVSSQFVLRKGFYYFGTTQETDFLPSGDDKSNSLIFFERGDGDMEHQAKVTLLAGLMLANFRGYFIGYEDLTNISGRKMMIPLMVALCHDVGEGIVLNGQKLGDIVDNETEAHDEKADDEFNRFKKFVETGFNVLSTGMIHSFNAFQKPHVNVEFGYDIGWSHYGLDKTEPVLFLAFLEQEGLLGHYRSSKKDGASDNDLRCIEIAETDNALDCIAVHLRMQLKKAPRHVTKPLFAILREAVTDVRGEFFPWWDKDVPEFRKGG